VENLENYEVDKLWEDLLAFVKQRRVIPVVDSESLTIQEGSRAIPLYRTVADRWNRGERKISNGHQGIAMPLLRREVWS
jgi:hypothetical protein